MTSISNKAFDGLTPKISPRLLPDNKAQIAQEVLLENGKIVPLKALSASVKTIGAGTTTIWRFGNTASDTASWMTFTVDASVIQSPVFDDTNKRIYWTLDDGSSVPKYAPSTSLFSGGIGPTGTTYDLGLPAPTGTPVANGSSTATVASSNWDYMVTYTSSAGDSEPSPTVTVKAPTTRGADWTAYPTKLSSLPVPETPAMYTGKKLWAKLSTGTTWNLVTSSLAVTATEFTDNVTTLGAAYSSTTAAVTAIPKPATPIASLTSPLDLKTATTASYYYSYYAKSYRYMEEGENGGTVWERVAPESVGTLSAVTNITTDPSQTVTLTIPATAYSGRPTGLYANPTGFAIFRRLPTDPEPLLIGSVDFAGASAVTFVDAGRDATLRYSAMLTYSGTAQSWGAPPALTSAVASTSTAFTSASKVTYQYCQTFRQDASPNTEGTRSDDSEYVTVAEASSVRQQGVRLTIDPAPAGMTTQLYRRTVTINAASGGTASSVTVVYAYKLLVNLPAGVGQYVDNRLNDLTATAALPTASDLTLPAGPTEKFGASNTVPGQPVLETRGYCYTFVSAYGEEGPPSPVSTLVDIDPAQAVSVTGLSTSPGAQYNITTKRLYRSNAGSAAAAFQWVADIAIATASYSDTRTAVQLGEVLPSEEWVAPETNMVGLCLGGNGIAAGFTLASGDGTSQLCFSEPYMPHAWPLRYQQATGTKVVALVPFGGNCWGVLTTNYPSVAVGTDPASINLEKIADPQACVSKASAVATDNGVVYASPDGLCLLTPTKVEVVTENLLTRAQWQAYGPTTMRCLVHNGRILVFYTATVDGVAGGVLIFDFSGKSSVMTRSSISTTGGFYDAISDTLFVISGTSIKKWASGTDQTWTWKSKLHSLPQPTTFAWAQVEADAYPVTLKFYIGGTNTVAIPDGTQLKVSPSGAAWDVTVNGREPFRMPAWVMYRDIEIQISGAVTVHSIAVAQTSQELAQI